MGKTNILLFLISMPLFFNLSASFPAITKWEFKIVHNFHPEIPNGSLLAIFQTPFPVKAARDKNTPDIIYITNTNGELIESISVDSAIMTGADPDNLKITNLEQRFTYKSILKSPNRARPDDIILVFSPNQKDT